MGKRVKVEVKKVLAIVIVVMLIIPFYTAAHEDEKEQKGKTDDSREVKWREGSDLKEADEKVDWKNETAEKHSDEEEKQERKHEKKKREDSKSVDEKIGLEKETHEEHSDKKEKVDLTQKTTKKHSDEEEEQRDDEKHERELSKEEQKSSDEKLDSEHKISKKSSDEKKKETVNEKAEINNEKIDSTSEIDEKHPSTKIEEPKEAKESYEEGNSGRVNVQEPVARNPAKRPDKSEDSIIEYPTETPEIINDPPLAPGIKNAVNGSDEETTSDIVTPDASLADLQKTKNVPFFPTDPVGTAIISGLAMLSGTGAAVSLSPSITIPKAAAIEKSASFITKTMGAIKTVFGEFFEDWTFALHTRLKIPFISKGRQNKDFFRDVKILEKLDGMKYSFLNTETSLFELLKMSFCVLLLGVGFSAVQLPDFGSFFDILPMALFAVGTAIFAHELAHDIVAHEYGVDTRFEIWPLGVGVMLISVFFGGIFAAFMNGEIEGKTREHGAIYLAGPLLNLLLAILFFQISALHENLALLGKVGAAVNITIAAYNLLPIKPVDGYYIYRWNKFWWTVLAIPSFVVATSVLEGVAI